jgi:hypothetical protein
MGLLKQIKGEISYYPRTTCITNKKLRKRIKRGMNQKGHSCNGFNVLPPMQGSSFHVRGLILAIRGLWLVLWDELAFNSKTYQ